MKKNKILITGDDASVKALAEACEALGKNAGIGFDDYAKTCIILGDSSRISTDRFNELNNTIELLTLQEEYVCEARTTIESEKHLPENQTHKSKFKYHK